MPLATVVRHPITNARGSVEVSGDGAGCGVVVDVRSEEKRRSGEDGETDATVNTQAKSSARRLAITENCKNVGLRRYGQGLRTRHTFQTSACMRTTFPNERSTPLDSTRSCSRGGGCGGVSAYHAPSRARRMRGIFKTDDISASIAVVFAGRVV